MTPRSPSKNLPLLLICTVVIAACAQDETHDPPMDAGDSSMSRSRVEFDCRGETNTVLYACTTPNSIAYLGEEGRSLARLRVYSCGVRVTPRAMQVTVGRIPHPIYLTTNPASGQVTGSNGTNYFPNARFIFPQYGYQEDGVLRFQALPASTSITRTFRVELPPLTIGEGASTGTDFITSIAGREDRPGELVGPEFLIGMPVNPDGSLVASAIEITIDATGASINPNQLREASWSSGCGREWSKPFQIRASH